MGSELRTLLLHNPNSPLLREEWDSICEVFNYTTPAEKGIEGKRRWIEENLGLDRKSSGYNAFVAANKWFS